MIIDLRHKMYDHKLFARILVEQLFRMVHAEKWPTLDNILTDVESFKEMLDKGIYTWWWRYNELGSTFNTTFKVDYGNFVKIEFRPDLKERSWVITEVRQ